jgi:hypothetical protein
MNDSNLHSFLQNSEPEFLRELTTVHLCSFKELLHFLENAVFQPSPAELKYLSNISQLLGD